MQQIIFIKMKKKCLAKQIFRLENVSIHTRHLEVGIFFLLKTSLHRNHNGFWEIYEGHCFIIVISVGHIFAHNIYCYVYI